MDAKSEVWTFSLSRIFFSCTNGGHCSKPKRYRTSRHLLLGRQLCTSLRDPGRVIRRSVTRSRSNSPNVDGTRNVRRREERKKKVAGKTKRRQSKWTRGRYVRSDPIARNVREGDSMNGNQSWEVIVSRRLKGQTQPDDRTLYYPLDSLLLSVRTDGPQCITSHHDFVVTVSMPKVVTLATLLIVVLKDLIYQIMMSFSINVETNEVLRILFLA